MLQDACAPTLDRQSYTKRVRCDLDWIRQGFPKSNIRYAATNLEQHPMLFLAVLGAARICAKLTEPKLTWNYTH